MPYGNDQSARRGQHSIELIARTCHETNRAICEAFGDFSQVCWDHAKDWQRQSAIAGVLYALEHPDATPEDQHEAWAKQKREAGWVYGTVKDEGQKTHPCLVPYAQLPPNQRVKDGVFKAIVNTLTMKRVPMEPIG
jgi:hypothetical protein